LSVGRRLPVVLGLLATAATAQAQTPAFSDADILEPPSYFRLRSFAARYSHFEQTGEGFQSRAGPPRGPGSQDLSVEQPQIEAVIEQGEDLVHRFWIPVDIVTAASPDAVDVVSTASRTNEAGALEWTATYREKSPTPVSIHGAFHSEENYRSYSFGVAGSLALAEDNTVFQASGAQVLDWFDKYAFDGRHDGHAPRSSTSASAGLTQVLSPGTIGYIDYGITYQQGVLTNTWNTLPYLELTRVIERLPAARTRHAAIARVAQWLPWDGVLKASYRFYADDWGIVAHSAEFELDQRLHPYVYLGALYRIHTQTAARFYVEAAGPDPGYRTADSDLAAFDAHALGGKVAFDLPVSWGFAQHLHIDAAIERYIRTNDLEAMVYTCELGFSR
jgi:hypothetical protein